jgi:hypothetical protein
MLSTIYFRILSLVLLQKKANYFNIDLHMNVKLGQPLTWENIYHMKETTCISFARNCTNPTFIVPEQNSLHISTGKVIF